MALPQDLRYINNVLATTLDEIRPILVDNLYSSNALFARLYAKERVTISGGSEIRVPFLYADLPGGSYSGTGPFVVTSKEILTTLRFQWKQNYKSFTLPGIDVFKNSGPHQAFDLVSTHMKAAQMSMGNEIGTQLYSDGSNSNDITGLRAAVGSASNVYGGLTRSTSDPVSSKIIPVVDTTGGAITVPFVNSLMGQCSRGGASKPDLLITTQTLWDALWARVQPQQRIAGGSDHDYVTKVGFEAIYINGALVVADSHCPDGYLFGLNTDYIEFYIGEGKDFYVRGPFELPGDDAFTAQLILYAELAVQAPNLNFTASGLTA
jgi:hypothetical protein